MVKAVRPAAYRFVGPEADHAPTSHSPPLPSLATSEPPPPTPILIPRHCAARPWRYVRLRNTSSVLGLVVGRELGGGAIVGMDEGQRDKLLARCSRCGRERRLPAAAVVGAEWSSGVHHWPVRYCGQCPPPPFLLLASPPAKLGLIHPYS
jgi:hypothetical protein